MQEVGPAFVVIEGIEEIIARDLAKHKAIVERTKTEIATFRTARAHEIKKKKHYRSLIGGEKYNDDALRKSIEEMAVNIRHTSDKAETGVRKLEHHTVIVGSLTEQLAKQNADLAYLAKWRKDNAPCN